MHRLETIDLGPYRGRNYFLTGFVEPAPIDGADYDPGEDADVDTKVDLDEDFSYGRMKQYLPANWRRFADLYVRYNE